MTGKLSVTSPSTKKGDPIERHVLHWFRRGLRLHDNPALRNSLAGASGGTSLRCVYIMDPWFAGGSQASINKWRFVLQSLEDLDHSLRKLNSRLYLVRGQPTEVLPKLLKQWAITHLSFEEDPEPFGRERDEAVTVLAHGQGIKVVRCCSHTLYGYHELDGGRTPLTYKRFQALVVAHGPPQRPSASIDQAVLEHALLPVDDNHDELYAIPSLVELGFDPGALCGDLWRGGETEALVRLERHLERKAYVASFATPKFNLQSLFAGSQTGLSPYLTYGCLSSRLFYWKLHDLFHKVS